MEFERNRERYAFLRWGQNAFSNFRVVPPDTGIVHQVNLEYLARVVMERGRRRRALRLPRHPGRHRLPHHDDQRPRRARLGRRRHRGRGGHARPAGVDAHPAGRRLPARRRSCPRAPPRPTWSSPSPRCCARRASSASSSSSSAPASPTCRSPTAPRSPTWPPSTAPPAASSRSTQETLDYLQLHRPLARAGGAGRGLHEGAGAVPHARTRPRPVYTDTLELDLGTVEPSLAGPRRPQDRVRLSDVKPSFLEELRGDDRRRQDRQGAPTASACSRRGGTAAGARGRRARGRRRGATPRRPSCSTARW